MDEKITLDYGSGGLKTSELIESILLPAFKNDALSRLGDGAVLPGSDKLVFSTDSFVVSPWRFPGGDIGKLSVCGTVNDVCMAGGAPKYLSLSFIIEEGFSFQDFRDIVSSVAEEARACDVSIVTGDTKVVDAGKGDGIYINTAGIGFQRADLPGKESIRPGDAVLVSGTIGCHGAAVMMARSGMLAENSPLRSDCAPLHEISAAALNAAGPDIRVLRDPTRGGIATTLNEFTEGMPFSIELGESVLPVDPAVEAACDMLGLDPLYCACEGRMLIICSPGSADQILAAVRAVPGGENAARIGTVTEDMPGKVLLRTPIGGRRILAKLTGIQLPRIC
ncbi:MAG TPA: hydrogenase expression/formation protein HypE [Candidatus Mediterraneibacter quadrami]|uniref:Hydrogenase expression/formation protein HypE n=1 Tax=Candidatus Mediterraneibacter quadrami TaxID=2838684 RepID=A0A9D2REG9_9FIRM|nr:hydrogenase expression/formation protein HypE [Candidatus Mediterraneibacter quadrami]